MKEINKKFSVCTFRKVINKIAGMNIPLSRALRLSAAAAFLSAAVLALAGAAQGQGASSWSDPDAEAPADDARLEELIDKLDKQIDNAEQKGSAHPRFLKNLRALADSYRKKRPVVLLSDDFSDGDFTANPAWVVSEGRYYIERGFGLRSTVSTAPPAEEGGGGNEDLGGGLLGLVLKKALKKKGGAAPPEVPKSAAAHLQGQIVNAFTINLEIYSMQGQGLFEFGPYQGADRGSGYRLVYRPGGQPGLQLQRVSQRGAGVVDSHSPGLFLEDQKTHAIEWTRSPRGEMVVSVDGKELIRALDQGFKDPFDGFAMTNRGGDYILRKIIVSGVK